MQLKISWHKGTRIIALSLCLSSGTLQYTVHTSIIAAKIVSLKFLIKPQYFGSDLRLAWTKATIPIRSVQSADCRSGKKCRLGTKCRLQTADQVQNADWEFVLFFRLILDNMSSYNLPSVTQALFRDHLSRFICTIVEYSLHHNRSYYNFKLLQESLLIFPCGYYSEHIYS